MEATVISILEMIAGPLGGFIFLVVLFAGLCFGCYKLLDKHVLPAIQGWLQKQDERFEKIMTSHEEDRTVFKESVEKLTERLDVTDNKVNILVRDLDEIKSRTFVCPRMDSTI